MTFPAIAPAPSLTTLAQPQVLCAAAIVLLFTAALGFAAGLAFAPAFEDRRLRRSCRIIEQTAALTIGRLDRARAALELLEQAAAAKLPEDSRRPLAERRDALVVQLARLVDRTERRDDAADRPVELQWQLEPLDAETGLPDRAAFEANLGALVETGRESGLLLVRMDKPDQLIQRFGAEEVRALRARLVSVICRAARDSDLTCRFEPDTLGVLIPLVDHETGATLAATIRAAVRQAHFRLTNPEIEVLVTASFGYTSIEPNDCPALVVAQAVDALVRAERRGRNQLSVHAPRPVADAVSG